MAKDVFLRCSDEIRERYLSFPRMSRQYQETLDGGQEYSVLDFETTGFDPVEDRIIEVAALRARGEEVVDRCESLIDPGCSIPTHIRLLTGIGDEMVSGNPTIEEYFPVLREFLGELPVVAYSRLEAIFLRELYASLARERFENPYIDAMDLAIMLLPCLRSHRQIDLASIWALETGRSHRAADDVDTLNGVYNILLNALYNLPLELIKAVAEHSPPQPGGFSLLLERVLSERSAGRPVDRLRLEKFIPTDRSWEDIPPLTGKSELQGVNREDVRGVFEPDGVLAGRFDDYEERDEQLAMAEATRTALTERKILLVEAGTGTGKSLAYLVPGVLWAQARGMPVVVSTRTLNLQDQLSTKDLPLLESALGKGSFRYTVLKGYSNYICLRKLQALLNSRKSLSEEQLGILGMLLMWLREGGNGDVSLLNVSYLRGLNYHVMADHRECPGDRCKFARSGSCYYRDALYRARRSHVVVVNHSLLLAGVNLPFESAVIDEAHTLEDVATEQFTLSVEYAETKRFLEFLHSPFEGSGFLADAAGGIEEHLEQHALDGVRQMVSEAKDAVEECLENLERLFVALTQFYEGEYRRLEEVRFTSGRTESLEYDRLASEGERFELSLDSLAFRLGRISAACSENGDDSSELEYFLADLDGKGIRVAEIKATLETVLAKEGDGFVRWATVTQPARFERQSLMASPVDVGPSLAEFIYEPLESLVMTSATLTVNDSFDFFRSRVGLDLVQEDAQECLTLDSSFDFGRQMQILILHDMPAPDSKDYERSIPGVLQEAIRSAGGGTLALFTNRRLMLDTYNSLIDEMEREGLHLLCQQPGYSRRRLAEEFVEDEHTSLLGTSSFWQGVDARGDTLRLVVVTRIPFESPGRPVFEARSERIRDEGQSDFSALSLPLAALRLKQGVGRLIRTRQDRGQVLIMDSRISSRRYGQILLRSLPRGKRRKVSVEEVGRAISEFHRRSDSP